MKTTAKRSRRFGYAVLVGLLLAAYGYQALHRSLPALEPVIAQTNLTSHTTSGKFVWPAYGSAAVGLNGGDILVTNGPQKALPIASTAKVLTALSVLAKKPLTPGQPGPTITLTEADVAIYNQYVANGGSVVPVSSGEQITEYQMLEALMLPSANNFADSLAIWAFGSLKDYRAFATSYARQLGLTDTHVGSDASGLAPDTTGTAHDLVVLGKTAMQNPVLASIVGLSSSDDIPGAGPVKNVNSLLGTSGVVGIKTGNTDQAGGVFLSASTTTVDTKSITIVTAVLGAPTLWQALNDSRPLIRSAQTNFSANTLIPAHNVVGSYRLPWGGSVPAITKTATTVTAWNGSTIPVTIQLRPVPATSRQGQIVGTVTAQKSLLSGGATSSVGLAASPPAPSVWWRLGHPF
jgi:serine-type D-Ala-D-Ala carboxypeptidase (penicillin-binding protein 5/6)